MTYQLFKKYAFSLDPELAHEVSMGALSRLSWPLSLAFRQKLDVEKERYAINLGPGLIWPFPVGLAAGLDKNAVAIDFFSRLYLGAIEVGTVTPQPQAGNPRPRLFRYPEVEGLRNCMGFNNKGMLAIKKSLSYSNRRGRCLGINLGKNKSTPQHQAYIDYQKLYTELAPLADYIVVNISSPNTPGLRDLQAKEGFVQILDGLKAARQVCPKPVWVKISPDLSFEDVKTLLKIAQDYKLRGVIATNTSKKEDWGEGGVSGRPILEDSRRMREFVLDEIKDNPDFHCIGVGGFSCFKDVWDFWKSGGKAVQIYSAFIYQGPKLFQDIKEGIDQKMREYDFNSLEAMLKEIEQLS